jgi:hypothetical protein
MFKHKMGYLLGISFLEYVLESYPDYQKISYHILFKSNPNVSFHIHKYPKISEGANPQVLLRRSGGRSIYSLPQSHSELAVDAARYR